MKKIIALFLVLTLVLSLAACGTKSNPPTGDPGDTAAASGATQPPIVTGGQDSSGSLVITASKYSEAYKNYSAVYNAITDAYNAVLDPHNAAIEASSDEYFNDPNHFTDIVNFFLSISIAYTATLGDDNYVYGITNAFEIMDRKDTTVSETSPGVYRLTYTATYYDTETWESQENVPFEVACSFNAANGALHFREYAIVNGEQVLQGFIDFVPLGGGLYALQSVSERAVAEVSGDKVVAFEYTAYADRFDPAADSIYPDGAAANSAWIQGGSNPTQQITLTADSLHIHTPAEEGTYFSNPERDITIIR